MSKLILIIVNLWELPGPHTTHPIPLAQRGRLTTHNQWKESGLRELEPQPLDHEAWQHSALTSCATGERVGGGGDVKEDRKHHDSGRLEV